MMLIMDASVLFSVGGAAIAFVAVTMIAISNERFLKGELKVFLQKFVLGSYFIFAAILIQLISDLSPGTPFVMYLIRSVCVYMSSVFFFLAANDMYELSKVLGFAPNRLPKKLKKILSK